MDVFIFLSAFCIGLSSLVLTAFVLRGRIRTILAVVSPCLYIALALTFASALPPLAKLILSTAGLLYIFKFSLLLKHPSDQLKVYSKWGMLLFMTVWPGFDLESFASNKRDGFDGTAVARDFVRGYVCFLAGSILFVVNALLATTITPTLTGFVGIAAFLMIVHFGYANMLTSTLRLAGWNVKPLFDRPVRSASLRDFWSHRWNLAFVAMDKLLFYPFLRTFLGRQQSIWAIFVISGLLHEFAISFPAGGGWGGPLLYFVIQAAAMFAEKKLALKGLLNRVWTYLILFAPLPLLFHEPFRAIIILPPYMELHRILATLSVVSVISAALWCAGVGHFCTLAAGLQVPFRLHWREELARVSSFNRKIFLNYAAYVGMTIIAFGWMTLALHDEFMRGDKTALALAAFITTFWLVRLLVDRFYFGDADWPAGPQFVIGHALLNTLFVCLTGAYSSLLIWKYFYS